MFQISDVYLMVCLKLHTSQGCLSSNFLQGHQIERVNMELPCIWFALPTGNICGGVSGFVMIVLVVFDAMD